MWSNTLVNIRVALRGGGVTPPPGFGWLYWDGHRHMESEVGSNRWIMRWSCTRSDISPQISKISGGEGMPRTLHPPPNIFFCQISSLTKNPGCSPEYGPILPKGHHQATFRQFIAYNSCDQQNLQAISKLLCCIQYSYQDLVSKMMDKKFGITITINISSVLLYWLRH